MDYESIRRLRDKGPYDNSLERTFNIYDSIPYVRDISLCNTDVLSVKGGNLIKYYRCRILEAMTIYPKEIDFNQPKHPAKKKHIMATKAVTK